MSNRRDNDILNVEDRISLGLLKDGFHFLSGEITETNITDVIKWIIYENLQKVEGRYLTLYINSIGGSLQDAFALIDVMSSSSYPIRTVGVGSICSAAFLIFAAGYKGSRFIAKSTSIMCHQFSDEIVGKQHDIKAQFKEVENANKRMIKILQEATGLDSKAVRSKFLSPTDVWFTPEELIELKVADQLY